ERLLGRANLFVACIAQLIVFDLVWIVDPNPLAIGVILAISGTVGGAFNVVFGSIRQRIVPNHLLGRVMASFPVISWGSLALAARLVGDRGQAFGLPAVFLSAAAIHALLLLSRTILTDEFMDEVEAQAALNADATPEVAPLATVGGGTA